MTLLLFLHIAGSVLFLGNIITAAFWKVRADVRGDAAEIHRTVNNVMLADYAFTLPGLLLLIVTGSLMAAKGGYSLAGLNWLTASLILFGITGVLWLAVLIPLQRGMIRLSRQALENGTIPTAYKKLSAYWAVFGILATLLPLFILYFMVSKPF